MLAVNQFWDTLEVCIVGKMYEPDYFKPISNTKIRAAFEKIAIECEEDLQKLIKLLERFNVTVIRTNAETDKFLIPPPITPRDYTAMIGNKFFIDPRVEQTFYKPVIDYVKRQGNEINWQKNINTACILRFGKDLLCGNVDLSTHNIWTTLRKENWPLEPPKVINESFNTVMTDLYKKDVLQTFKDYRCHFYDDECHLDGRIFSPVPGLLITSGDMDHKNLFKGWDILRVNSTVLDEIKNDPNYNIVKERHNSKWWVPGEELNLDFTNFVHEHLYRWIGYIEESQFYLNILMIDSKNAVVSKLNDAIAKKLEEYDITLHVIDFRHSLFFDGGIHCLTSDIKRKGKLVDLALLSKRNV
jgi:hypothetical protein